MSISIPVVNTAQTGGPAVYCDASTTWSNAPVPLAIVNAEVRIDTTMEVSTCATVAIEHEYPRDDGSLVHAARVSA
jgi:hypothetical protein